MNSGFHFANPTGLGAALLIPLLWLLFRHGDRGRIAAMATWGEIRIPPTSRALLYISALFLAFGLARPTWRAPQPETAQGGDLVFLLDVSRSMLANDAVPSRLERAKMTARALVAEAHGQRVALVAFSGS